MNFILLLCTVLILTTEVFAKSVLVDVRTPQEYSERHLTSAINVDVLNPNFILEINKLSHDDFYQVYCGTGRRSANATAIMKELGFKNVEDLKGIEEAAKKLKIPLPPLNK